MNRTPVRIQDRALKGAERTCVRVRRAGQALTANGVITPSKQKISLSASVLRCAGSLRKVWQRFDKMFEKLI